MPQLPKVCERDERTGYYRARRLGSVRMARRRDGLKITPRGGVGSGRADGEKEGDQGQGYGTVRCGGGVDFSTHPCGAAASRGESALQGALQSPVHVFSPLFFCSSSDRKSTRLNSSHSGESRMPSSA